MKQEALKLKYNISTWDKLKINFWGIPKAGNTSIKKTLHVLSENPMPENIPVENWVHHIKYTNYIKPEEALSNGYYNFAVLRDPIDRFISMYKDVQRRTRTFNIAQQNLPIDNLLKLIENKTDIERNIHFRTQTYFLREGVDCYNVNELSKLEKKLQTAIPRSNELKNSVKLSDTQIGRISLIYKDDFELLKNGELQKKKVLLLASGLSSKEYMNYDYIKNGWTVVSVNNGWQVTDEWHYWVHAPDFKGDKPKKFLPHQREVRKYSTALRQYGGQRACGYSITLNAGYWVLANLRPDVIGFLGADMNYTPDENGNTHIYGVGYDIKHNQGGIPDPDRMVNVYGKGNPNYLNDIYTRLSEKANDQGCDVYNFSSVQDTRLPYEKSKPYDFD